MSEIQNIPDNHYQMYLIVSKEALKKMNGIRGKMFTQAGHGYLHAFWDAEKRFPEAAEIYKNSGFAKKITAVVETDSELTDLYEKFKDKCGISLVVDRGLTVFNEPTQTFLGIGPLRQSEVGELADLKLLV